MRTWRLPVESKAVVGQDRMWFGMARWEVVSAVGIPWIVRLVARVSLKPAGWSGKVGL